MESIDAINLSRTVLFVGDYFSMMTTVVMNEELRAEGEDDDEFAIRLAKQFILGHYGWDMDAVSNEIGIVEEQLRQIRGKNLAYSRTPARAGASRSPS